MYYLFQDPETTCYVFTREDPRKDGFPGMMQEAVRLDIPEDLDRWPEGTTAPHPCLAVSEEDGTHYRVFQYRNQCRPAGYRPLSMLYAVHTTWADYRAELMKKG
jgi:hypothetical protein